MKYFDAHSHLNLSGYETDLDEVIKRMTENETGTIAVGTDYESSVKAIELADKYENIWACIGVHPVDNPTRHFDISEWGKLVTHPKVVAIGECGMDFFHVKKEDDYERQKTLFIDQIEFAVAHDKPIMIHARNAYEEILEILESLKPEHRDKLRGDVHFFAGNVNIAERFFTMGFTVSFTGVITFTHDYDEVIKEAPLEMILSETDAPWVTPVPYRGKRNEPSYVSEVVKKIAEIRAEDLEMVQKALVSNAFRVFRL